MRFEIRNGSFAWPGREEVFSDINVTVESGDILAVLGANGIGKTTLLRAAMGFLPWKAGGTYINGRNTKEMTVQEVWAGISYVPQAKTPAFALTAIEMTVLGRNPHLKLLATPKQEDYEIAERALTDLGILHLKDKPVNQMSGGELQMVLIARALAGEPQLLILDEPESNLDFANQLKILTIIQRLSKEKQISCIFNTHYPQHAFRIAKKALLLGREGQSEFGRVEDVLTVENVRSYFRVESLLQEVRDEAEHWMTITPLHLAEE